MEMLTNTSCDNVEYQFAVLTTIKIMLVLQIPNTKVLIFHSNNLTLVSIDILDYKSLDFKINLL